MEYNLFPFSALASCLARVSRVHVNDLVKPSRFYLAVVGDRHLLLLLSLLDYCGDSSAVHLVAIYARRLYQELLILWLSTQARTAKLPRTSPMRV